MEYKPIEAPDGYLFTYFDVSQAEPRCAAYMSKDPNFMKDYDEGKDIYMELGKQYRPDLPEEEVRKKYRQKCKAMILALHYGMTSRSLSHNLDFTVEETEKLMQAYFDRYAETKKQIDECVAYAKRTGEILTVFGDKLRCDPERAGTQGFNYRLQNGASVSMQAGFMNMSYACRQLGFDLHPKSVIHDSNQNMLKIVDLFYVNYAYRKFFRKYEREYIGVDYKYDLELMKNYRDHTVFEFDYENSIMTLDGPEEDINYYLKWLKTKWDIVQLGDEYKVEPISEDLILDYSQDYSTRGHQYCMHPEIRRMSPMIYGMKFKVSHDWQNDEMIKLIDSLPLDVTDRRDVWVGKVRA